MYKLDEVAATPVQADLIDSTFTPHCLGEHMILSVDFFSIAFLLGQGKRLTTIIINRSHRSNLSPNRRKGPRSIR